jgi:hypothetical protein
MLGSMIGNWKKSMSSSWSLGAASAKNVPISIMADRPCSSEVVASWNDTAVACLSKNGSRVFHRSKTFLTWGSVKLRWPASSSR